MSKEEAGETGGGGVFEYFCYDGRTRIASWMSSMGNGGVEAGQALRGVIFLWDLKVTESLCQRVDLCHIWAYGRIVRPRHGLIESHSKSRAVCIFSRLMRGFSSGKPDLSHAEIGFSWDEPVYPVLVTIGLADLLQPLDSAQQNGSDHVGCQIH
jgi:hypothetical protein